MSLVTVCRS